MKPHYRSPFAQMGDRMERLALLDRHPAAFGADTAAGRKRKREADDDDKLLVSIADMLSMFTTGGRKDFGKFALIIPDDVQPDTPDDQPTRGITRHNIITGQPKIERGKFFNLLMEFLNSEPHIPWVEVDNRWGWFSVRIEPWKTVTWEITR